jgi:glycerol-3-phosphate acyltransferase PlsY
MMNPFQDVNWNPGLVEKRKFALSLTIGFPALAIIFSVIGWLVHHSWKPFFLWLGGVGFCLGILLYLLPQISRPFYLVWYFIACCLGIVTGNVIFGLLYYLVLSPFGIVRRTFNPEAFSKRFDKKRLSYWHPAEKRVDLKRYYRQF